MEGFCFFFGSGGGTCGLLFLRLFFFFLSLLRGAPRAQESAATWPRVSLLFITSADVHNFRERHLLLFPLLPLFPLLSRKKKIIIIIKSLLSGNFAVRVELERCPVSEVFEGLKKVSKFPHAAFTLVCGRKSRLPSRSLPGFPDGSAPLLQTFVFLCCLRARLFSPLASKPAAPVVSPRLKTHLSV